MIPLKKGKYYYIPIINKIVNPEFADLHLPETGNGNLQLDNIHLDRQALETNVRQLRQVVFEMTQLCNLNCDYCSYSGDYKYHRTHSDVSITLESAKKAIDYLLLLLGTRNKKELHFGFYGGEPLLQFDTMKKIVAYAIAKFDGWDIEFSITTNGTRFNDEIIDWLIFHQFDITLSLDGPKKNHDAKRKFHNGTGSFDCVIANLNKIRDKDASYYTGKLAFNITYSNDLSLSEVISFYRDNMLVNRNIVRFTRVNLLDTDYYDKYPYDESKYFEEHARIIDEIVEKKIANKEMSPVEETILRDITGLENLLKAKKLNNLASTCRFDGRLYIDAKGRFHVCEKMNDQFPIGDVDSGFDFTAMERMACKFSQVIESTCRNCDFQFLCQRCFAHFAGNGNFVVNPGFCANSKDIIFPLERLIELKEGAGL